VVRHLRVRGYDSNDENTPLRMLPFSKTQAPITANLISS
jgi:hypothetical protein